MIGPGKFWIGIAPRMRFTTCCTRILNAPTHLIAR
jgi:hypothetical protein